MLNRLTSQLVQPRAVVLGVPSRPVRASPCIATCSAGCSLQSGCDKLLAVRKFRMPQRARQLLCVRASYKEAVSGGRFAFPSLPHPGGLLHSPHDQEILRLLVPALLAVLLDPAMLMIDTAIVGRLGTVQLAAQGTSNLLFFFITILFSFLLVITTPQVADAVAVNDMHQASRRISNAVWVALACGIALGLAMYTYAPVLTGLVGGEAAVRVAATSHLRLRALACPAAMLMFVATGAFRGFKDTRTPLFAGIAQNSANLLLDLAFVFLAGFGLRGAAGAATCGQYLGVAVIFTLLIRRGLFRPADLKTPPGIADLKPLARAFVLLSICTGMVAWAVLGATQMASGLGAVGLAAHYITKTIIDFCMQIFATMSTVCQTLVAAALGRQNPRLARDVLIRVLQIGATVGSLVALAVVLSQGWLVGLFSTDAAVLAEARYIVPLVAFILPLAPCQSGMEGALLGALQLPWIAGRTLISAAIALAWLHWPGSHQLGLLGVWGALCLLPASNFLLDLARIAHPSSPIPLASDGHED